jgi:hypothetical protein
MANKFYIDGYWKDDKSSLDSLLVVDTDDCPEEVIEEDVFFFGLSEQDIQSAIAAGEDTIHDFVITKYCKEE